MDYRRGALLFFEVIHKIWRSHGLKNQQFEANLCKLRGWSQLSNPSDLPCFKVKHFFGHISGMIGLINVKPHEFYLGCFKVKFRNSCISGIVCLIDVKWKEGELIGHWANCMTLSFDHTHDLDIGISRSESEIALSQEWDGWLTWNKKDVSHPFMTMILISVTTVGWADVPDSDQGDFRCRRAVDISSL